MAEQWISNGGMKENTLSNRYMEVWGIKETEGGFWYHRRVTFIVNGQRA